MTGDLHDAASDAPTPGRRGRHTGAEGVSGNRGRVQTRCFRGSIDHQGDGSIRESGFAEPTMAIHGPTQWPGLRR